MNVRSAVLIVVALFIGVGRLDARQAVRGPALGLERIESLIADGEFPEARSALSEWWSEESGDASRDDLQKAYWLRGKVTTNAQQASIDFRRLVVEFPGGPYSDKALLRLALLAQAEGEFDSAVGYFRELLRDYPGSPLRSDAENWLNSQGLSLTPEPDDAGSGSTVSSDPRPEEETGAADEADNEAATAMETGSEPAEERPVEFPPDAAISIQLGAFSSLERATRLHDEIEAGGFRARLVRVAGSDLVRVRVGRWVTEDEADSVLDEVRAAGFEAIKVRDATSESEVGGSP